MAVRGEKLLGLFEQAMNADRSTPAAKEAAGVAGYNRTLRKMLGIVEAGPGGEPSVDLAQREFDPKEVSLGELWRSFKPRRMSDGELPMAMYRTQMLGITEAEGHVVMPSHFANVSAFSATVAGLLDAMIIDAYQTQAFKGDQFFPEEDSRMNGGNAIGVMNDGEGGDNLNNGEAYPTVGLKETKILIPENQRRGNTIQVNELDFVYDRTGKIQQAAENAGTAIRRFKEIAEAKVFLGIVNNYVRDGNAGNTYQKTAGFVPVNYVNSVGTLPLTGFADIQTAKVLLSSNRDPGTGFEIEMPAPVQVAVMPQNILNLQTIARATEVETRSTDQTRIFRAESPLFAVEPIELPMLWYNLLVASGVSATNAAGRWWAGNFKRSFRYRRIIPFESREAPLSSEDVRRDIVLIRVAREIGVPFTWEPRYSGAFTVEA